MKTRYYFYLMIILSTYFIGSLCAEDSCPSGMRIRNVDETNMINYGSADKSISAICTNNIPGSLFFEKRVLIEPRFEVHLKTSLDALENVENSKEQRLYGFTITVSGYNNTISGLNQRSSGDDENYIFNDMGYNNYINSLIIEFDFYKDSYDPDSNSFSIRYCNTRCSSNDQDAWYSSKLTSQRYDPTKNNVWDFRLVYADKKLIIYSGPNEAIYTKNVDLEETLNTNIAFVGFTGFMESNRRELSIIDTFICEDDFEITKMGGSFYLNGKNYETVTYEAGSQINYLFSFINDKDQIIPHTYGYDIWDYDFTINTDCGQKFTQINEGNDYNLIVPMQACTEIGEHTLYITEKKKGNAPARYYTIIAGPIKNITLIGYERIIRTVPLKDINGAIYLAYGDSSNKDFIIKKDLEIILELNIADQYGNNAKPSSPASLFTLKKVEDNGETSAVTSNIISYVLRAADDHYRMTIAINKIGTYQIDKNDYMSHAIRFTVVPGEANPTNSYCTLKEYSSSPILYSGNLITYNCYLFDKDGNEISIKNFEDNSQYEFTCQSERISPSSQINNLSPNDNATFYSCSYMTDENGKYQINGYLKAKGTTGNIKITSKINQFTVRGNSDSLVLKNVYDLYNKKWVDINNAQINYLYDEDGLITILDLAESDGVTLISSYKVYPSDFQLDYIKAEITNSHESNYKCTLKAQKKVINGAEYIGIYLNDPINDIIKKSSFHYSIDITYIINTEKDEKIFTLQYPMNIGAYKTCFHELDEENTYIEQDSELEFIIGEEEMKIGRIELKTKDSYLYNKDIGKENIVYSLENNDNAISFRIVPLYIEGTYDVYGKATEEYNGDLIIKINGKQIKTQTVVSQVPKGCTLQFKNENLFKNIGTNFKEHYYNYTGEFTTEGNLLFYFTIQDKFNNVIVKEDYFSEEDDIYSEQFGNDKSKYSVKYNKEEQAYEFVDNLPYQSRKYSWVFKMKDSSCNNLYYIYYDGMRGGVSLSLENSYFKLLYNNANINEYVYVEVFYMDERDQLMGLQPGELEKLKDKTKVYAKRDSDGETKELDFETITSSYSLRFKKLMSLDGIFIVTVKYDSTLLKNATSKELNITDNQYSLEHSKLQMILDQKIDMDKNKRVTVDNSEFVPTFKMYFYSSTGIKTTSDNNFTCVMTKDNNNDFNMILNVDKKTDYLSIEYDNNDINGFKHLPSGDYELKISDNKDTIEYPLYLTGDGTDTSDTSVEEYYDISKTQVNPVRVEGIAGQLYSIILEFRASDNLRWKYDVDPTKFVFSNSKGLSTDEFIVSAQQGNKRGQAIITVIQTKVINEDNILTITYNGENIPKTVSFTIKCGEFSKLVEISVQETGNVINPQILTFRPEDVYGNLYTDLFSNSVDQNFLNSLTIGKSTEGDITLTPNNYREDNQYLKVQYKSKISTNISVTSSFFTNKKYSYRISNGPIDSSSSYAEFKSTGSREVGTFNIMIYPKDINKNEIDDLNIDDINKFNAYYTISGSSTENKVTDCKLQDKTFNCSATITKAENIQFHVKYNSKEIECKYCKISVISTKIEYSNTQTLYKNKNSKLKSTELNSVEAKINPIFEVTFYDKYSNKFDSSVTNNLDIEATLEGTDIKFCISNSGEKKIINLCGDETGNDNENRWQYVTNGEDYKLILKEKNTQNTIIEYGVKITGGATSGSSEKHDLSKTKLSSNTLNVRAGYEGTITMEIQTAKGVRKNYWYPYPSEKIKLEFTKDKDTCSYQIERVSLPGEYAIKIVCTKINDNNSFSIIVESEKLSQEVKVVVSCAPAYYLEVENNNQFTSFLDKYTLIENPTNENTQILFKFKLKDKYENYITEAVDDEISIASETYGASTNYYILTFSDSNKNYEFTDKTTNAINKHTWNIICIESQKTYSFIKTPGIPDVSQSDWTIDKTNYIQNEISTILITLKDTKGINVGIIKENLLFQKNKIKVVGKINNNEYEYTFNSITSSNELKYQRSFSSTAKYEVSVNYNGEQIKGKKSINVEYQKIDLEKSELYYDIGDSLEGLMQSTAKTNIGNKGEYPFFKLYLFTSTGEKITNYDKSVSISCIMIYNGQSTNLQKQTEDSYIKFTYLDSFKTTFQGLSAGTYNLQLTISGKTIEYPLYLLSDKETSTQSYDLAKTYIKPSNINGIAGIEYKFVVEFRASDNLRWNSEVDLSSITIENSYKLDENKISITKQKGAKSGQVILLVTQYVSTTGKSENILTVAYKKQIISQKLSLNIKCSDLASLAYEAGAQDGTVTNPSIVKFVPKDKYDNLYTDLFDEKIYTKEKLKQLTNGKSTDGYTIGTNNYVDGQYLNVQYSCTKVTTIEINCNNNLNSQTYSYKLLSGPIFSKNSLAQVEKIDNVIAGNKTTITIYPKDIYGNNATNINYEEDLSKIYVDYSFDNKDQIVFSSECFVEDEIRDNNHYEVIKCSTTITKSGSIKFNLGYNDITIPCQNCNFDISPSSIDFTKIRVYNKNQNIEMSRTNLNYLSATTEPNFVVYFFDEYMNSILNKDEVNNLEIIPEFKITDIKLCASNNNDLTKSLIICNSNNNDDNEELWKYLPNGDNYKLIIYDSTMTKNAIFPVKITGGYNGGGSRRVDPLQTNYNPTSCTLVAGKNGTIALELRTSENIRKNFWYKEPNKHISIEFPSDVSNCMYTLERALAPGQYSVIFNCTEEKDTFKAKVLINPEITNNMLFLDTNTEQCIYPAYAKENIIPPKILSFAETSNELKNVITGFVGYQYSEGPYEIIRVNIDKKWSISSLLPKKIAVYLNDYTVEEVSIPVSWNCEDDIDTSSKTTFIYTPTFSSKYILSDTIKNQLPYINIVIIDKSKFSSDKVSYSFTKNIESYTVPYTGEYLLKVYGAIGGGNDAGKGGYSEGTIGLYQGDTLYIVVGGKGNGKTGGYNGGGNATLAYGGGGATHIGRISGLLTEVAPQKGKLIIAAGGGGGSPSNNKQSGDGYPTAGGGGGLEGTGSFDASLHPIEYLQDSLTGGTQLQGYQMGLGETSTVESGAGGGGYWGGYQGSTLYKQLRGGGGSGYVEGLNNPKSVTSQNSGDGKASIEYKGASETELILDIREYGTWNGQSGEITIKHSVEETILIPNPIPKTGYKFVGWEVVYGDGKIRNNYYTYTFKKTKMQAKYLAPLSLINTREDVKLNLVFKQEDEYVKEFKVYQSLNKEDWYLATSNSEESFQTTWDYVYTGKTQKFTAPSEGWYDLEVWGAQGGGEHGGLGAYMKGSVRLSKGQELYIHVGGTTNTGAGGWNGGGSNPMEVYGGGGATDISLQGDNDSTTWDTKKHLYSRIIVAGGGGGYNEFAVNFGGNGGFPDGQDGGGDDYGYGGKINAGGKTSSLDLGHEKINGSFGKGGTNSWHDEYLGAGGAGWYGGGAGGGRHNNGSGGGGSSYFWTPLYAQYYPSSDFKPSTTLYLKDIQYINGENSGNGRARIGYKYLLTSNYMNDVSMEDKAAPNVIPDIYVSDPNAEKLELIWEIPQDNGITYYHQVKSYEKANKNRPIAISQITEDIYASGIKGYHYYFDKNPTGTVTTSNSFTTNNSLKLQEKLTSIQYLHIAAIDNAGNMGPVLNYEMKPSIPIEIKVIPGAPYTSKLFKVDGKEITEDNLGSISVENEIKVINKLYDKYGNLITNVDLEISDLQIELSLKNTNNIIKAHTWSAEPVLQTNGEILITLKSTFAGVFKLTGLYISEKEITFTHGEPNADNSELELSKTEAITGDDVEIYITPYDKYNNYIDANEFKDVSPYQVKYKSPGEETKVITNKHTIKKKDEKNVLTYIGTFIVRGTTILTGYLGESPIKCVSCRININSKEMVFENSYVLRFESSKSTFELLKNLTTEKNNKEEPIYRLYPRDMYNSSIEYIPNDKIGKFTAYLENQDKTEGTIYHLKLNNKDYDNQEYAEFIINNDGNSVQYKYLVEGYYYLRFNNGEGKELVYNISLTGSGNGGSNNPIDIQKTHIDEYNLTYYAGDSGYMVIEIRTSEGIRKNSWDYDIKVESCDENDNTFEFIPEKAGIIGVFHITVTSKKANTYPSYKTCNLKIYVNNTLVDNLSPEMKVYPNSIVKTEILQKYYKPDSNIQLLDGNADTDYIFEVASYDKYDNFAETIQEIVGLKVVLIGENEVNGTTSETNKITGYRKYTVPTRKAGTYVVSTDKTGPNGLYLSREAIFVINPGEIDLSKTFVKEKTSPINTGEYPAVNILAYDKYGNPLSYDKYINNFTIIFTDAKNNQHESTGKFYDDIQKLYYTSKTPVTVVGNVKVDVTYNNKDKVDTSKVIIVVIARDCSPINSILSREINGEIIQYKNGDNITIDDLDELLFLNITIYDEYKSYIENIPADVIIDSPTISGNNMDEIKFDVTRNIGYFGLDFYENENYVYTYKHLVRGTYNLTYKVKTSKEEYSFKYNIIITCGDDEHGNGNYDINKCIVKPNILSFIAGNYEKFYLELRTKQGLLYNDDIDKDNDILIEQIDNDPSFNYTIEKESSNYGIYVIEIYSHKKGEYNIRVKLTDLLDKNKKEVGQVKYIVSPEKVPYKYYTVNYTLPDENMHSDKKFDIVFTLADRFDNLFDGRNDIIEENYLTLINNNEELDVISISLSNDKNPDYCENCFFKVSAYTKYPPKNMSMNILYSDGENSVYCFANNIIITIISEFDPYQTQIVSSNKEKIKVGEILDMWLYTFDKKGECYDENKEFEIKVTGPLDSSKEFTKIYSVKKYDRLADSECNNEYKIITTDDDKYIYTGNYIIKVNVKGNENSIAQYNQICYTSGYSTKGFLLDYDFDPDKISILDTVSFTISGSDEYGNSVEESLYNDISIYFTKDGKNTTFNSRKSELIIGQLKFDVSIPEIGSHQLHILYKNEEIATVNNGEEIPVFTILIGPCYAETNEHFINKTLENAEVNTPTYFSFQCYDIYNNKITSGGEEFTVSAVVVYNGEQLPVNAEVVDNNDGTYNVEFIPEFYGNYLFNLLVRNQRYGQEYQWPLIKKDCSQEGKILCPNNNKCEVDIYHCIDDFDKCNDTNKPFYCKINGIDTCTESKTNCDCPDGYVKCDIMKYCVPEAREDDMCPFFGINNKFCTSKFTTKYKMFYDGICRLKTYHGPNQRVCPIGEVLCADLSCRSKYEECEDKGIDVCPSNKVRCIGQEIVDSAEDCPSTYTCDNENDFVCPDGTCVKNEVFCPKNPKCATEFPYRCQNNQCSLDYKSCSPAVACGHKNSLCSDNICRTKCS